MESSAARCHAINRRDQNESPQTPPQAQEVLCILDCLTEAQIMDLLEKQYAVVVQTKQEPDPEAEAVGEAVPA